jgi:hypothetical protein
VFQTQRVSDTAYCVAQVRMCSGAVVVISQWYLHTGALDGVRQGLQCLRRCTASAALGVERAIATQLLGNELDGV